MLILVIQVCLLFQLELLLYVKVLSFGKILVNIIERKTFVSVSEQK